MRTRLRNNTPRTHRCQGQERPSPVEVFVLIAIVAIFAATLLPAALQAAGRGRATCTNNLRQLLKAFHTYRYDHDGCTPPIQWRSAGPDEQGKPTNVTAYYPWPQYLLGGKPQRIFKCPEDDGPADLSYDFNRFLRSGFFICGSSGYDAASNTFLESGAPVQPQPPPHGGQPNVGATRGLIYRVNLPEKVIVFFDWENQPSNDADGPDCPDDISARRSGWFTYQPPEKNASVRHKGRANYAFWDGHVEALGPAQVGRDSGGGGGTSVLQALAIMSGGAGAGCGSQDPALTQVEPWWGRGYAGAAETAGHDFMYNTGQACFSNRTGGADLWDQYGHRMFCSGRTLEERSDTYGWPPEWFWGMDPKDPGPGPGGQRMICTVDPSHRWGRYPYGAMPTFNAFW